jgi:hypothetical protein
MLQFFEEQRREDRRMADEREERYQRAADEREARREAHFNDIPLFSGARGQDLLPWLQLFRSRANLLHTPAEDIARARELCLKLEGAALQSYSQGFAADASPTFAAVAAHLSNTGGSRAFHLS